MSLVIIHVVISVLFALEFDHKSMAKPFLDQCQLLSEVIDSEIDSPVPRRRRSRKNRKVKTKSAYLKSLGTIVLAPDCGFDVWFLAHGMDTLGFER